MDGKPNPDSSSPDFLRHVQAALKRHRPLGSYHFSLTFSCFSFQFSIRVSTFSFSGTMQSNSIRPRRTVLPQRRVSNSNEQASSKDSTNTVVQNLDAQKKVQFSVPTNTASHGKI